MFEYRFEAGQQPDQKYYTLHLLAAVLSGLHHLDHAFRGNHVGWPLNSDINAFTYTLAIYPLIAIGFKIKRPIYWLSIALGGLLLISVVHFGPWAVEPPRDIIEPYASSWIGYLALGILCGLIATLLLIVFLYMRLLQDDVQRPG